MPRRKGSRVPSRAKPILPDDSITEADMEQEQRKEKLRLLLEDFDQEVQKRVEAMEAEIQTIQQSIHQLFKMDLMRYSEATRTMPWRDYTQQQNNGKTNTAEEISLINVISSADSILQSAAKKRGRKPKAEKVQGGENMRPPPSATRSTRVSRQRTVLGSIQSDNMPPPTTTTKSHLMKKHDPAATPISQGIPQSFMSAMYITPKFDPRTPLPSGTVKRKPLVGETVISLRGSPLQVSPPDNSTVNLKSWMASLRKNRLDEETKSQLITLLKE